MAVIERPETSLEDIPVVEVDRPEGPAVAAMVAAGGGCAALGLFTILAEVDAGTKHWLEWSSAVGALSGKTAMAVLVWLVAWAGLHLGLRHQAVKFRAAVVVTLVLVAFGAVATFPTVVQAFASE